PGELKRLESSVSGTAAQNGTEVRALRVVNTGAASQRAAGGAKVGYGFRDLRRQVGAQVLSAAGPLEFALEGAGMENGIFTFFLLSGIREKTADRNGDGAITVTELFSFVSGKVIELSEGVQQPRFRHANRAFDFALTETGAAPPALAANPPAPTATMARAPRLEGRRYPEVSERLLTQSEVGAMSFGQLRYAINELYAIHGFAFAAPSAAEIRKHFSQFSWFRPDPAMTMELIDQRMSETERRNIEILATERNAKK
ncbi:MAG TPA: YARHG domain-containing protein, partial [Bacteroidia bacterium]|nr:YARHG domain-containing protein [Bacteroidia bacterium]